MSKTSINASSSASASNAKILTVNRVLFLAYLGIGTFVVPRRIASIILPTLWLGFVLAISGMEAWLKFRAPFCPRPFALDIGRTIFPALNSVELGLCISIWWRLFPKQTTARSISASISIPLLLSTVILLAEVLFLTPKLVRRGKEVVFQHVKTHGGGRVDTDSTEFMALESELQQGLPFHKKTDKWHIVYVALELVKMLALSSLIGQSSSMLGL